MNTNKPKGLTNGAAAAVVLRAMCRDIVHASYEIEAGADPGEIVNRLTDTSELLNLIAARLDPEA